MFRLVPVVFRYMRDLSRTLRFTPRKQWRKWLAQNHATKNEALLIIYKRAPKNAKFSSHVGREEALCFGWIDGWFKPLDDEKWVMRYSPRRKGSNWSKYNIARAWNLLTEKKMTSAGTAKLPADVLEVWRKYKPRATMTSESGEGKGLTFYGGRNYLSMVRMPAKAP